MPSTSVDFDRLDRIRDVARMFRPKPPFRLSKNQHSLSESMISDFESFFKLTYYHPPEYWETNSGKFDLRGLTQGRLIEFRATYIPWLDSLRPLNGCRVLEIGCGTGASTVALAEQHAIVTAMDMVPEALAIARERCRLHGVSAEIIEGNAADIASLADIGSYDLIALFAVLEHMTFEERQRALTDIWSKMKPGAILALLDTPNRLWVFDAHTAYLPFFHWLPEEVAIRYARHSPIPATAALHTDTSSENLLTLQRWGRGVSYHDIDIAIGDVNSLDVVSSLGAWRRSRDLAQRGKWLIKHHTYHRLLRRFAGRISPVWLEPYIDVAIRR